MQNISEKIKQLSVWRNHNCLHCESCKTCHKCDNSLCRSNHLNNTRLNNDNTKLNKLSNESNQTSNESTNKVSIESSNKISNESTTSNKISNESSESHDNCRDRLHIDWKLQIYNNKFVYGINPAINDAGDLFFLAQYTGPELNLGNITLMTTTSAIFFARVDSDGEITLAHNLWSYDGVREDYQFAQLQIDSQGSLIVITTFVGTLTFSDGQTISEDDGNTMIAKFLQNAEPVWIRQITARSIEDTYFVLDANNNIYVVGTFTGTLSISDPDSPLITSNLESNMFVGKISSTGSTQWLLTATGSGYNTGEGITVHDDNTVVAIGTFNDTFVIDDEVLVNNDADSNMWVAKFNLDGDILILTSPVHPNNNQELDFVDGGQIISHRGNLYIAGEMLGNFIFSDIDIDVEMRTVFVSQLNSDLDFLWISLLQVDIPTDNSFHPKLTATGDSAHNRIFLSNFGIGVVHYLNDEGDLEFRRRGSGSLDQIISELSVDGEWLASLSICGTVENFSIPLVANQENVFVIGTHVINNERTDAFLIDINV